MLLIRRVCQPSLTSVLRSSSQSKGRLSGGANSTVVAPFVSRLDLHRPWSAALPTKDGKKVTDWTEPVFDPREQGIGL
jgi:hypothetical protein